MPKCLFYLASFPCGARRFLCYSLTSNVQYGRERRSAHLRQADAGYRARTPRLCVVDAVQLEG